MSAEVADIPEGEVRENQPEEVQEANGTTHLNGSAENESEHTDKIKKLGPDLKSLAENVQESSRALRGILGVTKAKNEDLRTEVDNLKTEREALQKANAGLHAKNEEQASQIQALETKIGNQDTLFHELSETLSAISAQLAEADKEFVDIVSELQSA